MVKPLTQRAFVDVLAQRSGAIDARAPSSELTAALADCGVGLERLRDAAGKDGIINTFQEFGKLFDTLGLKNVAPALQVPIFKALKKEVEQNRGKPEFGPVGGSAPKQERPLIEDHALFVPPAQRLPEIHLPMGGLNQMTMFKERANEQCYATAVMQAERFLNATMGSKRPHIDLMGRSIQIGYAEDEWGQLLVNSSKAGAGRDYLDNCLAAGIPVVVGVSYADESSNYDKLTDHFVTVCGRGYDDQGRVYYEFRDPGARGELSRFYVHKDNGKLFREGDLQSAFVNSSDYEMSLVVTYKEI